MKLKEHGENSSTIEVTNIDRLGFWMLIEAKEYHLSFSDFPWFAEATIKAITNVQKESKDHFFWPDLDVDLSLEMIERPETFPLKYK